jgi:hypothetical protein
VAGAAGSVAFAGMLVVLGRSPTASSPMASGPVSTSTTTLPSVPTQAPAVAAAPSTGSGASVAIVETPDAAALVKPNVAPTAASARPVRAGTSVPSRGDASTKKDPLDGQY